MLEPNAWLRSTVLLHHPPPGKQGAPCAGVAVPTAPVGCVLLSPAAVALLSCVLPDNLAHACWAAKQRNRSWAPAQLSPSQGVGDSGRLYSLPSLRRHVPSSLRGYCGRVTGDLVNSVTAYASSPLETRDKQAEAREYCSI